MEKGLRNVIVSVMILAFSGCSLALNGPDSQRAANVAPKCDSSKGLVGLDWVLGGLSATFALSALTEDEPQIAGLLALGAVAFVASAARGNGVVNECRAEIARYEAPSRDSRDSTEVADRPRPRAFEDPYASPPDLRARPIVAPPGPAVAPPRAPTAVTAPPAAPAPVAPPAAKPSARPAPAPVPDEDWSDFWTELQ